MDDSIERAIELVEATGGCPICRPRDAVLALKQNTSLKEGALCFNSVVMSEIQFQVVRR